MRAIAPLLPATAQVRTRAEQVQSRTNDISQSLAIVRYVLLAFGGIALFVDRRDLQHAVGDRRAAHPRVRDLAHDRRLAQAGAGLGRASRGW